MKLAILRSSKAYLPEADAYRDYLAAKGIEARCLKDHSAIEADEMAILFRGRDQMRGSIRSRRRIHEEHNHLRGLEGTLRRALLALGPQPDAMILLEHEGRSPRRVDTPSLVRRTGIDDALFSVRPSPMPDFDLVYCGTLERTGLESAFGSLAKRGFRIAVYGDVPDRFARRDLERLGVAFFGRIGRAEVRVALANARAGLNITPDIFPIGVQDSIKTLEYLAAGLPVVANRYRWMKRFAHRHGLDIGWVETMESPDDLDALSPPDIDLSDRGWTAMLDARGFIPFLERVWQ